MRSPARVRALALSLALLTGVLLIAAPMASAAKYALGIGDSPIFPAAESAPLHAVASRVVIAPAPARGPLPGRHRPGEAACELRRAHRRAPRRRTAAAARDRRHRHEEPPQ